MNKELYDKIRTYLKNNKTVEVEFSYDFGFDLSIEKHSEDYDFFEDQFGDWLIEEFTDLIFNSDTNGSTFCIEFELIENILYTFFTTNHLGIKEQEFNERFLKFEINYDGESYFFEVYYQEEKINLNKNDRSEIMQETKLIMQDWISTEWDSFKVIINQWDDSFDITGHESYRYEIKPS